MARDANAKRQDIARLHPGAKQIWVDSGHAIPLERPEAVAAAIGEIICLIDGYGFQDPLAGSSEGREVPTG